MVFGFHKIFTNISEQLSYIKEFMQFKQSFSNVSIKVRYKPQFSVYHWRNRNSVNEVMLESLSFDLNDFY